MYPRYGPAGGGLLRLHSTYRHDLKIYSSDEGRVQTSAAAFTQGLLDLEGDSLTPILVRCDYNIQWITLFSGDKACQGHAARLLTYLNCSADISKVAVGPVLQ